MGPQDVERISRILETTARHLSEPDALISVEGVKEGDGVVFYIEAESPQNVKGPDDRLYDALRHLVGEIGKKNGVHTQLYVHDLAS